MSNETVKLVVFRREINNCRACPYYLEPSPGNGDRCSEVHTTQDRPKNIPDTENIPNWCPWPTKMMK